MKTPVPEFQLSRNSGEEEISPELERRSCACGLDPGDVGLPGTARAVMMSAATFPYLAMSMPSATSPAKPKAEPSQYRLKVHVVVEPSEPGMQTKMSVPSPLTPVTENAPTVVRKI